MFSQYVAEKNRENAIWFDFEGVPVAWHLPVGVLFDRAAAADPELRPPWNLTVHFDNYPKDDIMLCPSRCAYAS